MVYSRGSAEDYDRFAAVTGDPGWSWNRLLPYFLKNEKWTEPTDHHDTRGQLNPAVHSTKGINSVSLAGFPWPIFSRHQRASGGVAVQFRYEFRETAGCRSYLTNQEGWLQSTIGGGKRSSSATSYLGPQFIRRENLHVLLHAQVTKLVNPSHVGGKLAFGGVQFSQGGVLFTAKAGKEIILSAGAVGTPSDWTTLTGLGIASLLHLPSVGRNASDQPMFNAAWFVNSNQTLDPIHHNTTLFNEAYAEWNRTHTGLFATQGGPTHIAWLRLDPESLASNNFTDPSADPNSPHFQVIFVATGNGIAAGITVVNPVSLTINSSNPFDSPIVDFGFLQSEIDLFIIRQAVPKMLRFSTWKDYIIAPVVDLENLSDDALDELIRNSAVSAFDMVEMRCMVDPDLLVKGANGLRIFDASVFPFIPSANTQAPVYVIAERGADLVKASWE
ncbi:aryl-alcohol oxidase-like protein [Mycena leptocephala]|nr:aryl-alcohol oxidase-like protein [Mycena leptocephala]